MDRATEADMSRDKANDARGRALALLSSRDAERMRLTRREALRAMSLVAAGLLGGCTPARIVLHCYPDEFSLRPGPADTELAAFADTVVPGITPLSDVGTRVFADERFPLHRVRAYFASDLRRRARGKNAGSFNELPRAARESVIHEGMRAGGMRGRIYRGAVYLVQVAAYAGIYDDTGCSLIDFDGGESLVAFDQQTYPEPERFLAVQLSADGNPG